MYSKFFDMPVKHISRFLCMYLTVFLLVCFPIYINGEQNLPQTPALNQSEVVIYNNIGGNGPVAYFDKIKTKNTKVKVYDKSGNLLGEGMQNPVLNIAYAPLKQLNSSGGYVDVTVCQAGMTESEPIEVSYSKAVTPTVNYQIRKLKGIDQYDLSSNTFTTGGDVRQRLIKAGTYYQVNVKLDNFDKVTDVTLPIKYDTDVLDLVGIRKSGSKYYVSSSPVAESITETLQGVNFDFTSSTVYKYGILKGDDISAWGGDFAKMASSGANPETGESGYRGEYQYLNTDTGLIKVNCGAETANKIGTNGSVLKLYFYAKQNATNASDPNNLIRLATIDDYDAENRPGNFMDRRKYYDVGSPAGATITLWGANLLRSPIVADYGEPVTKEAPLKLTQIQQASLPQSMSSAIEDALMPPNKLKIYNFTNYTSSGMSGGTLDEYIEDTLVLTKSSSDSGSAQDGDIIKVYKSMEDETPSYQGEMSNGVAKIYLGTGFLDPTGGTVYVSNSRDGQESDRISFTYPKEMARKVHFNVYSSTMDQSKDGADIKANPSSLSVKRGDRISIEIYFEDIDELMAYTFPIHFNPLVVKATDSEYNVLPTGTVTEENYPDDGVGFLKETELEQLSVNDLIIYYADPNDEDEILSIMDNMGITDRAEFDRLKAEITAKMETERAWQGGILYTGEREDPTSSYPYVDNEGGLVKVSAVSFVPSGELEKAGGHYFLRLYFLVTSNGVPEFRFATDADTVYDMAEPDGGAVHILGVDTEMQAVGVTDTWTAHKGEGKNSEIILSNGNAISKDISDFGDKYGISKTTQFVYYKHKFRDPGFMVYASDGSSPTDEELAQNLKRYYIKDGIKTELPPYSTEEVLPTDISDISASTAPDGDVYFGLSSDDYSKVYDLVYEYTDPYAVDSDGNNKIITATRKVVMIYKRGDLDRDGLIGPSDLSLLTDHQSNIIKLSLSDLIYKTKTANTDKNPNSVIGPSTLSVMMDHQSNVNLITQDYAFFDNSVMK